MEDVKELQETIIDPTQERIRIITLSKLIGKKLTNEYYADKLNRTNGAISQALSGYPNSSKLLVRINRHNNWLEKKYKESIQNN